MKVLGGANFALILENCSQPKDIKQSDLADHQKLAF
jgi:hypothetical protein